MKALSKLLKKRNKKTINADVSAFAVLRKQFSSRGHVFLGSRSDVRSADVRPANGPRRLSAVCVVLLQGFRLMGKLLALAFLGLLIASSFVLAGFGSSLSALPEPLVYLNGLEPHCRGGFELARGD